MENENIQELKFQVGEAWKGVYSSSTAYGLANVVQDPTGLSIYRSLKSGNVGHPLNDRTWWFCIIDLSSIKEESDRIAALNQSIAQDEALRVAAEELRQQHEAERVAAETQRNEAEQARISAEQARVNAESARATAEQQRITAEQGRVSAESARVQAEQARVLAETLRANAEDQRAANEQNRIAAEQQRIERAEQDHQRAESDHATYVDSLGAFDISSYHATDGVLAKYADLTAALGTNGANIPDDLRKGGMSVKFVQSSDNKYVQYRLIATTFSTTESDWQGVDDEPTAGSDNLVKSGGVQRKLQLKQDVKNVEEDGLFLCDKNGNVIAEFTTDGFDATPSSSFIGKLNISNNVATIENGAFLCNEKGEVFAEFKDGKFNAVGMQAEINELEDIGNVGSALPGQVLIKQPNGDWEGGSANNITYNITQTVPESLEGLDDVDANPSEGDLLKYSGGKWVNAHLSLEGVVTTDSRANHPLYGKHFFVFGDSHTEAPSFGLWQRLCELTGAIYHTLLRKSDGYFYTTTEFNSSNRPINEEKINVLVNSSGFNWANYANAAYTYAQANNFAIDYILVHNCHFPAWTVDNTVIPWVNLAPSKIYPTIFESAAALAAYVKADNWSAILSAIGGIQTLNEATINFYYGGKQQTLTFTFASGSTLNVDTQVDISFGGSSRVMSTQLTAGMSLTDCIDLVNQWAFDEYSGWKNQNKGTQGNLNIVATHGDSAGSYNDLNTATITITSGSNLSITSSGVVNNTTDISKASYVSYVLDSKDVTDISNFSKWLSSGAPIGWSKPNQMLGALQYIGQVSPSTRFVFIGFPDIKISASDIYADGSVDPYLVINNSNYIAGTVSNKSIEDVAKLFEFQYIDAKGLCGINPLNAYPTFYALDNVHCKHEGYMRWADCVAKYIK